MYPQNATGKSLIPTSLPPHWRASALVLDLDVVLFTPRTDMMGNEGGLSEKSVITLTHEYSVFWVTKLLRILI